MPLTVEQHLKGARDNLAFADQLRAVANQDVCVIRWAITALFYSAVHAVRGYLVARHGVTVISHQQMRDLERDHPELMKTKVDYDQLKQQSHTARYYLSNRFTWADFDVLRSRAERVLRHWSIVVSKSQPRP